MVEKEEEKARKTSGFGFFTCRYIRLTVEVVQHMYSLELCIVALWSNIAQVFVVSRGTDRA